jgi:hypothetical protein
MIVPVHPDDAKVQKCKRVCMFLYQDIPIGVVINSPEEELPKIERPSLFQRDTHLRSTVLFFCHRHVARSRT